MGWQRLLLSGVLGLALAGCAGYRLGPTGGRTAGAESIRVPFVANETLQPRLSEPVTLALRRGLQQDGTYRLETRSGESAQLEVETTLLEYTRTPTAFNPNEVTTAQEYEVYLRGRVRVKEVGTGKAVLERVLVGRTSVLAGADQTAMERQALPLLAEDFASKAVRAIAEGPW